MKASVLLVFALASLSGAACQTEIRVPRGKPVMLDGIVESNEWQDAALKKLPSGIRIYAKRSDEYLWLAIAFPEGGDGTTDLYLSPAASEIYDLHASAKPGERRFENGKWPEWKWWNNRGWTANVSRVDSFSSPPTFLPAGAREYQIRLDRFPGRAWRIMFESLTPSKPEWKQDAYPSDASNVDPRGWWTLVLDGH